MAGIPTGSGGRHCYAIGCTNGDYKLSTWPKTHCEKHGILNADCKCPPPFKLYNFPTKRFDPEGRKRWLKTLSRADPQKPQNLLEPKKGHRVCSIHFVDGIISEEHPDPELHLGHPLPAGPKRNIAQEERRAKRARFVEESQKAPESMEDKPVPQSPTEEPTPSSPSPGLLKITCQFIIFLLLCVVRKLKTHIVKLQNDSSVRKGVTKKTDKDTPSTSLHETLLKNDSDTLFYTGIPVKRTFHKLHSFVSDYVKRRWKGSKVHGVKPVRKFLKSPRKFGPRRHMNSKDEFLLTLMKLRLGCLNRDLANRFAISTSLVSQVFNSWLTAMSKVLKHLVFWPDSDAIHLTKPKRFHSIPGIRAIIDCSEIFVETPKDLRMQYITWSDYKHHNTGKFLIAVAPNSKIIYVSPVYGGRSSDKAITVKCKFLDKMDPFDILQADKGFNIQDECAARMITLQIPPGKRGQAQMSSSAVKKTRKIANLRILVEQVIRRLKNFRILKNEFPITLVPSMDKIVIVCSALCNLRDPIMTE